MRIQVLHNWGGVPSDDRRVEPGEYDISDPALWGCGDYLVRNGHAIVIEEPEVIELPYQPETFTFTPAVEFVGIEPVEVPPEELPAEIDDVEPESDDAPKPPKFPRRKRGR